MFRYLLFLLIVGGVALSVLWSGWPAESQSLLLPTLEPLTLRTEMTATPSPAEAVNPSFAVAPAAPPDVNQAYAVTRIGHNQVSLRYQNQTASLFDCDRLDADVIFAGLANHPQYLVRTLCAEE
jgi:hypothetical protein